MQQVEETTSPFVIKSDGLLLKSELVDQPAPSPIGMIESAVAPPPMVHAPLSASTMNSDQVSSVNNAPRPTKRSYRPSLTKKKMNRPSVKPASLVARPSISKASTILPYPQQSVVFGNQMAPLFPKAVSAPANTPQGFTTYLVVDGSQGQFVQVANDGQQPVTFRNQAGQVLQATPINVLSTSNQPTVSSFPVNVENSTSSNSVQTVTTVRTSSSVDLQQQTTLTSDRRILSSQQIAGILHQPSILSANPLKPTIIPNGNHLPSSDCDSSLNGSRATDANLSLSIAQLAQKANQRHRRSSSSSVSRKKRGRPRLYERDPFTNKPTKHQLSSEQASLAPVNSTNATLLMPSTATMGHVQPHSHAYNSIIFPDHTTTIPVMNGSLLQQHQYSYPSLLNGSILPTNGHGASTFNIFTNNINTSVSHQPTGDAHPGISPANQHVPSASTPRPTHGQYTVVPQMTQLNSSPIKSQDNDVAVHYIGGFVIRESNQPFPPNDHLAEAKEKENHLRFNELKTGDFSAPYFAQERKSSSLLSHERPVPGNNAPFISEPTRIVGNTFSSVSPTDEHLALAPDHDLPMDPSKWTVFQVGEFVARLTNPTVRDAFYESEMDGQALLLMTPEHLRDTLKIKLGPSLIISSEIAKLRERAKTFPS